MYWIIKNQKITDLWVSIDCWHYYLPQRVYFNFIRALFETWTKLGGRRVFCTGLKYDSVARWVRRRHYRGEAHGQRCRWGKQILERGNFWRYLFQQCLVLYILRQLGLPDNSSLARLIEITGYDSPTFACSIHIAWSRDRPNHRMKAGRGTNSTTIIRLTVMMGVLNHPNIQEQYIYFVIPFAFLPFWSRDPREPLFSGAGEYNFSLLGWR